jgi:hypothetical protein
MLEQALLRRKEQNNADLYLAYNKRNVKIRYSLYEIDLSTTSVKRILIDDWHFILINKDKNFRTM